MHITSVFIKFWLNLQIRLRGMRSVVRNLKIGCQPADISEESQVTDRGTNVQHCIVKSEADKQGLTKNLSNYELNSI